jgi:hypothetical protein
MPICTKQISICFNTKNQYVEQSNIKDIGQAYIQIPFPVKTVIVKEMTSDLSSDNEYYSLMNSDLLGGDSCLGILYLGFTSLIKDFNGTRNNKFVFNESKIINGNYNFFLRNSQLNHFSQFTFPTFTGDVADTTSLLTVSAGTVPSTLFVPLGTGVPSVVISPPLFIIQQLTATTYRLNRTITPAYVARVFTYEPLSGCIQVVMEFSSD